MPRSPSPADALGLPKKREVTKVHRRAVMQAAHRTRKALGIGMGEAMKQAWKQLRQHQRNGWPDDRLTMPHERVKPIQQPQFGSRVLLTRYSGRLAGSFAA